MFRRFLSLFILLLALLLPGVSFAQDAKRTGNEGKTQLSLSAIYGEGGGAIAQDVHWRVYAEPEKTTQTPKLVADVRYATPVFSLAPGLYVVHASLGLASATRRIVVGSHAVIEKIALDVGALRVTAKNTDKPIPRNRLKINLLVTDPSTSEERLVVDDLKAGDAVTLPAGTYTIVSTYGDANAIVRADARIQSGKLTEAAINHRGATMTLKLVSDVGGEALANTAWNVLTPGGDIVREAVGAFPSITLAEGTYIAIARHDGKVFSQEFKVSNGFDKDVEVMAH